MQTARTALSVAARVCPRTGLFPWTKPAGGMSVLVHTSPPSPGEFNQNCLVPNMRYRTGQDSWTKLDVGFTIAAGIFATAGLYGYHKAVQNTLTLPDKTASGVEGVRYVPSDSSLKTGLNQALEARQTPAGVRLSAECPCGKNEAPVGVTTGAITTTDAGSEVSGPSEAESEATIEQEDKHIPAQHGGPAVRSGEGTTAEKTCKCRHEVSDETPTAVGPAKMGDKKLAAADDGTLIKGSKMSDGTVSTGDGGATSRVDAVHEKNESLRDIESLQKSAHDPEGRADENDADDSSENDVTGCVDNQGLAAELPTSSPEIGNQKSPSAPPPRDKGHVPGGTAEKDHGFCEDEGTSGVNSNITDVNSNITDVNSNITDVSNNTSDIDKSSDADKTPDVGNNISDANSAAFDRPDLPQSDLKDVADEEVTDDAISSSEEKCSRHADFTAAEVMTVTACPVQHELSAAAPGVTGSETPDTYKQDTEMSAEEFLSDGALASESESGSLPPDVPVSPRLQKKLRCAVLCADWRENSQFCHPHDVMPNDIQKVHFSWLGDGDGDDLDDVSEVKIHCAILEGVWREDGGLVENHVTSTTGGDDDMAAYYPGHGRGNIIWSGNESWT